MSKYEKEFNFLNQYKPISKTANNSNSGSRVNSSYKYNYNSKIPYQKPIKKEHQIEEIYIREISANKDKKTNNIKYENSNSLNPAVHTSSSNAQNSNYFSFISPMNYFSINNKKDWGHSQISLNKNTPKISLITEKDITKKFNKNYSNNKTYLINNFVNNNNNSNISKSIMFNYKKSMKPLVMNNDLLVQTITNQIKSNISNNITNNLRKSKEKKYANTNLNTRKNSFEDEDKSKNNCNENSNNYYNNNYDQNNNNCNNSKYNNNINLYKKPKKAGTIINKSIKNGIKKSNHFKPHINMNMLKDYLIQATGCNNNLVGKGSVNSTEVNLNKYLGLNKSNNKQSFSITQNSNIHQTINHQKNPNDLYNGKILNINNNMNSNIVNYFKKNLSNSNKVNTNTNFKSTKISPQSSNLNIRINSTAVNNGKNKKNQKNYNINNNYNSNANLNNNNNNILNSNLNSNLKSAQVSSGKNSTIKMIKKVYKHLVKYSPNKTNYKISNKSDIMNKNNVKDIPSAQISLSSTINTNHFNLNPKLMKHIENIKQSKKKEITKRGFYTRENSKEHKNLIYNISNVSSNNNLERATHSQKDILANNIGNNMNNIVNNSTNKAGNGTNYKKKGNFANILDLKSISLKNSSEYFANQTLHNPKPKKLLIKSNKDLYLLNISCVNQEAYKNKTTHNSNRKASKHTKLKNSTANNSNVLIKKVYFNPISSINNNKSIDAPMNVITITNSESSYILESNNKLNNKIDGSNIKNTIKKNINENIKNNINKKNNNNSSNNNINNNININNINININNNINANTDLDNNRIREIKELANNLNTNLNINSFISKNKAYEMPSYLNSAKNSINESPISKLVKGSAVNDRNKGDPNFTTLSSVTRDMNYYKEQSFQLREYIKDYYEKNKAYPNTNIDFYKYGRLIGQGAFGQVNLGLHVLSGRVVAIKSFNKNVLNKTKKSADNMKKIIYETDLMKKLNHPNITKILEVFETEKFMMIIMEYINGGNLFTFVKKRRKLSEKIAKFLFRQIIQGIKYIHSQGIVHRDIKLENILIDLKNTIKICDFGIGRSVRGPRQRLHDQCGTPMYMAPEILTAAKDQGYEPFPVDMWSSGIALYIMLSGTLPFEIRDEEGNRSLNNSYSSNGRKKNFHHNAVLQYAIINKDPKKIENISNEARNLLHGLLEKDPKKRFTIDDVLNHPWLSSNSPKNYNLFTKAEMIVLSRTYIDYRNARNDEEIKENFTVSNLFIDEMIKAKPGDISGMINVRTKSTILAPFNSIKNEEEEEIREREDDDFEIFSFINNSRNQYYINNVCIDIPEIQNNAIIFGKKVKEFNMLYELNNNGEVDNGILINSRSETETLNNDNRISEGNLTNNYISADKNKKGKFNNDYEDSNKKIIKADRIIKEIVDLGYNEEYIRNCLKNEILCYATATFYLMYHYENL